MIRDALATFSVQGLYSLMNRTFTAGLEQSGELDFSNRDLALYLHFPFCDKICRYCPFSRTVNNNDMIPYLDSILSEIDILETSGKLENTALTSIFFGGGTPSLIPEEYLIKIMNRLRGLFPTFDTVQKTIECTPESITKERLLLFESLGFNRLTIGVQSLQDSVLTELGRTETRELIQTKLALVAELWNGTWSCDLIYGFNSHTKETFLADIEQLITLGTDHLSLFPLINSDSKNRQNLTVKQFRTMNRMHRAATLLLESKGFTSYSVEDYGKSDDSYCHYQQDVWEFPQRDMVILGSGGFGINGDVQYRKMKNRTRYIEEISRGNYPVDRYQPISPERSARVRPLMGLHYNTVSGPLPLSGLFRTMGIISKNNEQYELTSYGRFVTSLLWAKVMLQRMVN